MIMDCLLLVKTTMADNTSLKSGDEGFYLDTSSFASSELKQLEKRYKQQVFHTVEQTLKCLEMLERVYRIGLLSNTTNLFRHINMQLTLKYPARICHFAF